MTDSIAKAIEIVMEKSNIPFAILISKQGERFELGDRSVLRYPDFPRTLFYDEASTKDMYEYLKSSIQPRMISQGEVKTIIGETGGNIFAFFLNSADHVLEHYKYAKELHQETLSQIENEI